MGFVSFVAGDKGQLMILKAGLIQLDVSSFWHDVVIGSVVVLAVTIDSWRRRKEIV